MSVKVVQGLDIQMDGFIDIWIRYIDGWLYWHMDQIYRWMILLTYGLDIQMDGFIDIWIRYIDGWFY